MGQDRPVEIVADWVKIWRLGFLADFHTPVRSYKRFRLYTVNRNVNYANALGMTLHCGYVIHTLCTQIATFSFTRPEFCFANFSKKAVVGFIMVHKCVISCKALLTAVIQFTPQL